MSRTLDIEVDVRCVECGEKGRRRKGGRGLPAGPVVVLVVLLVEHYRSGSRTRSASSRNDSARDWLQILAVKSTICNTNSISSMCAPYKVGRGPHAGPVLHPASLLLLSNCLLAINRLCLFSWRNLSWDVFQAPHSLFFSSRLFSQQI